MISSSCPRIPCAAGLLATAAEVTRDVRTKAALLERLNREYPGSDSAGLFASDSHSGSIGKPFNLEFANAINSKPISMKHLKGKVVVIDFWATWCGPCVAEMPKMKELYAKYQDQGVEFIGVSLDKPREQGGLDNLKKFVKEHEIAWPQYFAADGEFARYWKVNAIPRVFIVDAEGKLRSTEARGKLEQMIPALWKKRRRRWRSTNCGHELSPANRKSAT